MTCTVYVPGASPFSSSNVCTVAPEPTVAVAVGDGVSGIPLEVKTFATTMTVTGVAPLLVNVEFTDIGPPFGNW